MNETLERATGCSQSTGLKWPWIKPVVIAGSTHARNWKGTIAEGGRIMPDLGGGKNLAILWKMLRFVLSYLS